MTTATPANAPGSPCCAPPTATPPEADGPAAASSCCGAPPKTASPWRRLDKAWLAVVLLPLGLALWSLDFAGQTVVFAGGQIVAIAPWFALAIGMAAWAKAANADRLIASAVSGKPLRMIVVFALFGGLSPFCSCGVVPIIAALLTMGVPVSAVLAFCLASPIMDPAMFALTAGTLGTDFAIAKTVAAISVGLIGGFGTRALEVRGAFANPLRDGVGNGGCATAGIRTHKPVVWAFWREAPRRATFGREALRNALLLGKWLLLAYMLENILLTAVPPSDVAALLGPDNPWAVPLSVVVGVPAYLNGYAALPLVAGLIAMGTSKAAAMGFLVGGAVTSIPAAMAVGGIVRLPVFAAYLAFALVGALVVALTYGAIL